MKIQLFMKYIKKFSTTAEYDAAEMPKPFVAFIEESDSLSFDDNGRGNDLRSIKTLVDVILDITPEHGE